MDAVTTVDVSKIYGQKTALHAVDLSVPEGAVFGLLGPKGAGRTTLLRLLCGLAAPTKGNCTVLQLSPQKDTAKLHALCGMTDANTQPYGWMTGLNNLLFFAQMYNIPAADARERASYLMKALDLWELRDLPASSYSSGAKERLSLARAVLHRPKVLFRDEPETAIDADSADRIVEMLTVLNREEGTTIVLCANMLEHAQKLCTLYGILQKGMLTATGTYTSLWQAVGMHLFAEIRTEKGAPVEGYRLQNGWLQKPIAAETEMPALIQALTAGGHGVVEARIVSPSLRSVYAAYTAEKEDTK